MMFAPHMAALTKGNQIVRFIGPHDSLVEAKGFDVMHRNCRPNVLAAVAAAPFVASNNCQSKLLPPAASIRIDAAYPSATKRTDLQTHPTDMAPFVAKFWWPVLLHNPWLAKKYFPTVLALKLNGLNPSRIAFASDMPRRKRIGRPQSLSPLVAKFVLVGHCPIGNVPFAGARTRAKPRCSCSIKPYGKRLKTTCAQEKRHNRIISQQFGIVVARCANLSSGTTAIAALRTGRNAVCIEKDKGYYDIMCKRVEDEQRRLSGL